MLLFFFLLPLAQAYFVFPTSHEQPKEFTVLNVPEKIFRQKTLDTYSVASFASGQETFNHSNLVEDPYKGSGKTSFALLGPDTQVKIYDLQGKEKKVVTDVYVECYDVDDCSYQLTSKDIAYLSLYASFIDNSGFQSIPESFSLGLIRGRATQNLMGMYTEGFTETTNHKAFWIRLWRGGPTSTGAELLYDDLDRDVAKTVALLELAVHERSHYDKPSYDSSDGHCAPFQTNYNSLIQRSYKSLDAYEHLTTQMLHRVANPFPWAIFTTTLVLLLIVIGIIAFS